MRSTHGIRRLSWIAAGLVLSCQRAPQYDSTRDLREIGAPARHALHSAQLTELMADLRTQMFDRMPQELDREQQRDKSRLAMAEAAAAMAEAARHIPDVLNDVALSAEHSDLFRSYAEQLARQSLELSALARSGPLEELTPTMDAILTTCNACHSAFRVLPLIQTRPQQLSVGADSAS